MIVLPSRRRKGLSRRLFSEGTVGSAMVRRWVREASERGEVLTRSRRNTVLSFPSSEGRIVAKIYLTRSPKGAVRYLRGRSRAEKAWWAGSELVRRGVPTLEPLACISRFLGPDYLFTRFLEGAVTLRRLLLERRALGRSFLREVEVEALASLIGQMHGAGIRHPDLTAKNIMISREGERCWIVDWDGIQIGPGVSARHRLRALSQLNDFPCAELSRRERGLFLLHYAKKSGRKVGESEIRKIERMTRNRRKRRQVREGAD